MSRDVGDEPLVSEPAAAVEIVLHTPRPPRWAELRRRGRLLERRTADDTGAEPVETFECDGAMWLIDGDLGEFRIGRRPGRVEAWPIPGIAGESFERRVHVDWLPIFYTLWGWQAVHAGAVVAEARQRTIAFVGPSGAGKSTLAYALGRRPGWRQLTDDATSFRSVGGRIELLPIPSESRLRPPSAERFGRRAWIGEGLPARALGSLEALYFLDSSRLETGVHIEPLDASRALQRLLEQAFAFTLKKRELRQRMVEDYFDLCAAVPCFSLRYRKDFGLLETVLDAVEEHCASDGESRAG